MSQVTIASGPLVSEKRIPRIPAASSAFNSASVTLGWTTATPLALAPNCARASTVTRLSVA